MSRDDLLKLPPLVYTKIRDMVQYSGTSSSMCSLSNCSQYDRILGTREKSEHIKENYEVLDILDLIFESYVS